MIIKVRVIPRARQNKITVDADGTVRVHTVSAPADGQANEAVVKMLAKYYDVPKTSIKIIRGQTCRDKVIEI